MRKLLEKSLINRILILTIIIGVLIISFLYLLYINEIKISLNQYEGMWSITVFIIIRIFITIGMMIYAFWKWNEEEEQFFSEINFLFGLFFLGLVYGKLLNLLYILTVFATNENTSLILLKIRYIFIIFTAIPLISIGINLSFSNKNNQNNKNIGINHKNKLNIVFCFLLFILELVLIILAPNIEILNLILISFHISSLIWISITFYYLQSIFYLIS